MKKKYTVQATKITFYEVEVMAEDEEQAAGIVQRMDDEDLETWIDGYDDVEIDEVYETEEDDE